MRLADYLRHTEAISDGLYDRLNAETRQMLAHLLISAALRLSAGKAGGARITLGNLSISTPDVWAWTPVAEALPPDDTDLLFVRDDGSVFSGCRRGESYEYDTGETVGMQVTHWAPLPKAPTT